MKRLEHNMKHITLALAASTLVLAACSGGSQFPDPTGKGSLRAIHAISTGPQFAFRVEESGADNRFFVLNYRTASGTIRLDDFSYNFNFEVAFAGADAAERVATEVTQIEANRDYTFVITGSVADPDIITWVTDERVFDSSEDVAELRFAHLAESVGTVDFYFAPDGTAPALGEAQGTLAYGEVLDPADFTAGDYVLTVTAGNDPATIVYQSTEIEYQPRTPYVAAIFDGTPADTAPVSARAFGVPGPLLLLPDARFGSRVQFTQASQTLGTVDIYNDEALTNLIVDGLAYQATSPDQEIAIGASEVTVTADGNPGAIQIESELATIRGTRNEYITVGGADNLRSIYTPFDRTPIETFAKVSMFNAVETLDFIDVYIVDAGASIDDEVPRLVAGFAVNTSSFALNAGSYDLIVTENGEKTPLAPPLNLDLANGDVVRAITFATADPNVVNVALLP